MSKEKIDIHDLAKKMSEAISTERERRLIADEAALETVLRENGWIRVEEMASYYLSDNAEYFLNSLGYRKYETSEWRITGDGGYGECANCGVAPFECEYPEDLRPGWAGYCPGCGAKMLGVNNGELLTWNQLSERRARKEAVRWAVYQGVCNYCDHSQKCSKYYENQFPPDTPCMMKKSDFLEVEK